MYQICENCGTFSSNHGTFHDSFHTKKTFHVLFHPIVKGKKTFCSRYVPGTFLTAWNVPWNVLNPCDEKQQFFEHEMTPKTTIL